MTPDGRHHPRRRRLAGRARGARRGGRGRRSAGVRLASRRRGAAATSSSCSMPAGASPPRRPPPTPPRRPARRRGLPPGDYRWWVRATTSDARSLRSALRPLRLVAGSRRPAAPARPRPPASSTGGARRRLAQRYPDQRIAHHRESRPIRSPARPRRTAASFAVAQRIGHRRAARERVVEIVHQAHRAPVADAPLGGDHRRAPLPPAAATSVPAVLRPSPSRHPPCGRPTARPGPLAA